MSTILVVDDDVELLEKIREILELEGHTVHVSDNSVNVLERVRELLPDVLVCDYRRPDIDGRDINRAIYANPQTQHTKTIFMMNIGDRMYPKGTLVDLDPFAPADIIIRPFGLEELIHQILNQYEHKP